MKRPGRLIYGSPAAGPGGFAAWVQRLRDRSGVYVIRTASSGTVRYVGESHSGRLYDTFTRHFQEWHGEPGEYAHGSRGAGPVYDRTRVECAVVLCSAADAVPLQNHYRATLTPKDNAPLDEVPF